MNREKKKWTHEKNTMSEKQNIEANQEACIVSRKVFRKK